MATRAQDAYSLLRAWRACMAEPRPSDWELIVRHLLDDTDAALEGEEAARARVYAKGYRAGAKRVRGGAPVPAGYDREVSGRLRRHEAQARKASRRREAGEPEGASGVAGPSRG